MHQGACYPSEPAGEASNEDREPKAHVSSTSDPTCSRERRQSQPNTSGYRRRQRRSTRIYPTEALSFRHVSGYMSLLPQWGLRIWGRVFLSTPRCGVKTSYKSSPQQGPASMQAFSEGEMRPRPAMRVLAHVKPHSVARVVSRAQDAYTHHAIAV